MKNTTSKLIAAKKVLLKSKKLKKDYSPQKNPQSKVYQEENDLQLAAKPVGYRFTTLGAKKIGKKPKARPTAAEILQYKDKTFRLKGETHRFVYQEKRVDKSDLSIKNKFADGGTTGAGSFADGGIMDGGTMGASTFKRGGTTFSGRQYDPYRENIDLERTAKPVGFRYTDRLARRLGVSAYARPTKEHIEKYLDRGVYRETRQDKSDLRPTRGLQSGGTLGAGSFARGGKTSYKPQYINNEDIASITLKSGKVIKNNSIYDGAYVSKSIKLANGGTMGAGSYRDGGTMGAGSYARGGVERIANSQAREYTENLIPFKGNNLEGKTLDNGDYVVLSYGYYPIWWYCKKLGKWYGNSTKYSMTTSKHTSQSRPTYDATMLSKNDLTDMMMKFNSNFEDGGFIDSVLSGTANVGSEMVGGTSFSQGSLTNHMDITNPAF